MTSMCNWHTTSVMNDLYLLLLFMPHSLKTKKAEEKVYTWPNLRHIPMSGFMRARKGRIFPLFPEWEAGTQVFSENHIPWKKYNFLKENWGLL